ncbi:MAG: cobalamin-binding protein [Bacteriovoracaceae bacterium]|nr:cobalamin-binding protein [Bacteriovoracaceae bacterium]
MSLGPKRIVCLTEETTELLYLLGEEDRIVGITAYTVRPPEAKIEKPIVTAFISGHIPKIKELKPDLVIGFSDIQAQLSHDLIKEGLSVLILNQRSLKEIFESMILIGSLIHRSEDTLRLVDEWKNKLDIIYKQKKSIQPKIFFQEWDDPIITGIEWVSELIEICGGVDCFSDLKARSMAKDRIVTAKDVADKNPEAIIGSWCGKKMDRRWVTEKTEWQNIPAIQNDQIHEIESSVILQPGPALFLEGVDILKKIIHGIPES